MNRDEMHTVAIQAILQMRPGKEAEVEEFLKSAAPQVEAEVGRRISWFAFKIGTETFGIFDIFEDDEGRQAHITGQIAKAPSAKPENSYFRCLRVR
jgi:hypothetical protein